MLLDYRWGVREGNQGRLQVLGPEPPATNGRREDGGKSWFQAGGNGSLFRHVTSKHLSNMQMEIAWTGTFRCLEFRGK